MRIFARSRLLGAFAAAGVLVAIGIASAPTASAHPLGNFTVNYYSGIRVEPRTVEVDVVVDRAEIPTLQAFPDAAAGRPPEGADAWRASQCAALAREATVRIGSSPRPLDVTSSQLEILPGAAGLATSRLECTLRTSGSYDVVGQRVTYRAATTSGRVGWHEVTARGNGTTLTGSDVPSSSLSKELTQYPQDLLTSPLDQRTASFQVLAGSGVVAAPTAAGALSTSPLRGLDRFTNAYTSLVSRTTLTPAFALLAIVLSMLLGGLHAFAPGHGKTLMAAYLVGREGTWRQAAVIGLSVTVTHTIGVLLLGVALSVAALAAPEQVYPWLGLLSGLLLAGIGISLLRSARTGHVHGPGGHTHGPGGHTHEPGGHTHGPGGHTHGPGGHTHGPGGHTHGPGGHTHGPGGHTHEPDAHTHEPDAHTHEPDAHVGPGLGKPEEAAVLAASHRSGEVHALTLLPAHRGGIDGIEHTHAPREYAQAPGERSQGLGSQHRHQDVPSTRKRWFRRGNWRLAAVGLAGGLVPSPSALLVLLGGIALGRAWFGALLVLFYGVGMAAALVGTGLLLVLARDRFEKWSSRRTPARALPGQVLALRLVRALPMMTAVAVMGVGAWIAIRSLMTI